MAEPKVKNTDTAVIRLQNTQFVVQKGDKISINRVKGEPGAKVEADVLLTTDGKKTEIGSPILNKKAILEIVEHKHGKKVQGLRFKAKSRYRRRYGHRQPLSILEVKEFGK